MKVRALSPLILVLFLTSCVQTLDAETFATPLHDAAEAANIAEVERLIAEVDARAAPNDRTPLHMAAGEGHTAILELLITRGVMDQKKGWVQPRRNGERRPIGESGPHNMRLSTQDTLAPRRMRSSGRCQLSGYILTSLEDKEFTCKHWHRRGRI